MEAIKRQIFVLRDTLKDTIDYKLGTDMVPIEYHVMDFSVPATAAAVVYVLRPDGDLDKILADVLDNVISFQPAKGFFTEGLNAIQIRVVDNNKALVSFTETVRAGKSIKFDDDTEAQQETLIEQLLTKTGKIRADIIAEKEERKEEISVERGRIDNLVKTNVLQTEMKLYSGVLQKGEIMLSEPITNFEYLNLNLKYNGIHESSSVRVEDIKDGEESFGIRRLNVWNDHGPEAVHGANLLEACMWIKDTTNKIIVVDYVKDEGLQTTQMGSLIETAGLKQPEMMFSIYGAKKIKDAELTDLRVMPDGSMAPNARAAIQEQIGKNTDKIKSIDASVQELEDKNFIEKETPILDRKTLYMYTTSTFSGWVTKFSARKYGLIFDGIETKIRARETAITKIRFMIAIGEERITKNVVVDDVIDVNILPGKEASVRFLKKIIIPENTPFYIGVCSNVLCDQLMHETSKKEYVSWYFINGDLTSDIESAAKGSVNPIYISLINKKSKIDKITTDLRALTPLFETEEIIENKQILFNEKHPEVGHTNSTFVGWGSTIGKATKFNTICFTVAARDHAVTKIKGRVLERDGEERRILASKIIDTYIAPGETKEITIAFDEFIENQETKDLYADFICDYYITETIVKTDTILTPEHGHESVTYFSNNQIPVPVEREYLATPIHDPDKRNQVRTAIYACNVTKKTILSDETILDIKEKILPEILNETNKLRIILPDKYQAVVGDTFQLFYRGIIEHPNPYIFNIETICAKGKAHPRYYELTPISKDVGDHTLTINVRDASNRIIATGKTVIEVVDVKKSPSSQKNILLIGDSLTSGGIWCHELDRRLTGTGGTPNGSKLTNISFIGTKTKSGTKYEGYGGWTWANYLIKPEAHNLDMWVYCTHNKTTEDMHSLWKDENDHIWSLETVESNRIKFTRYKNHTEMMPTGSGQMVHYENATHPEDITYTSTTYADANPFWDAAKDAVDFAAYCERNGFNGIDYVYTLLTWNGNAAFRSSAEDNRIHVNNAKTLIRKIHEAYPNAKVKICGIPLPSLNGGCGESYGQNSVYSNTYGLITTVMGLNLAYQGLANEVEFSDYVEFINISGQFDSENNMPEKIKPVNSRSKKTELIGTNGVHPTEDGYYQIGDAVYRNVIARITV